MEYAAIPAGRTDCSICHSSNGNFCRGCLKVRYGEELEEGRANKQWVCPHCIEEKEIRPCWMRIRAECLKKQKIAPTGIAKHKASRMGYKSVAHWLMDKLRQADKEKINDGMTVCIASMKMHSQGWFVNILIFGSILCKTNYSFELTFLSCRIVEPETFLRVVQPHSHAPK